MARENGQRRTCDRCGGAQFFKTIEEEKTDDGHTKCYIGWNKFEEATGWTTEYEVGDLCPKCSKLFKIMKEAFLKDFKKVVV